MNVIPDKIETINRIFDEKEDMLKIINGLNSSKLNNLKLELRHKVDMLNTYVDNITDLKSELIHLKEDKSALVHELDETKADMEKLRNLFPKETSEIKENINLQNVLSSTCNNDSSISKYLTSFFMQIGQAAKILQEKLRRFDN